MGKLFSSILLQRLIIYREKFCKDYPNQLGFFKIYIRDLTPILDDDDYVIPELNGIRMSHLLWADDLVLLALDPETLQNQITDLSTFCRSWGLEVNIQKTQILIFNKAGRRLDSKFQFFLGDMTLEHTSTFCYLGLIFTISGSHTPAKEELRRKTLRAYFSLKRSIDFRYLSTKAINNLYSALVKPVLSYGCPIWYHSTNLAKHLRRSSTERPTDTLKKLATDECERSHLRYTKWLLGVHKKTSNLGVWGDSGRPPILLAMTRQVLEYYRRARDADPNTFLYHAFTEQVNMNLDWHSVLNSLITEFDNKGNVDDFNSDDVVNNMIDTFIQTWQLGLQSSRKLTFYKAIKETFGTEVYLDIKDSNARRAQAKIRLSAHPLAIETGRYSRDADRHDRRCELCSGDLTMLRHLPYFNPIIEDEWHLFCSCPSYDDLRYKLPKELLSELLQGESCPNLKTTFSNMTLMKDLGAFISKALARRRILLDSLKQDQTE